VSTKQNTQAGTGIRDAALMALAVSSGATDAISYLVLGKVFTAFMTGNIVFLGLHASGAAEFEVFRVLRSLVCFSAGVILFRLLARSRLNSAGAAGILPREVVAGLVVMLIAQVAFLVVWLRASGSPSASVSDTLVSLAAFAMGIQSGAVISLSLTGIVTTAVTATLAALVASIVPHPGRGWRRLTGVLISLFVGATVGGLLLTHARLYTPLLPLCGTALPVAIAALDLLRTRNAARPEGKVA
jgi:uncharacterized membrane protein YoaK (UPF0700 family)